jgi:hypothetical protein
LVKYGLPFNLIIISLFIIPGCTYSTTPTYLKENIDQAIQDICKNEYSVDVKVKLVGSTLWIYLPLENMIVKSSKPQKYTEKFAIEENKDELRDGVLKVDYLIKAIPEQEKYEDIEYNKSALDKMNNAWKALRRVLFSLKQFKKGNPEFCCFVTADILNGFEVREILYIQDLKKVSYEFISWGEYHHRDIQESLVSDKILGDREGAHLDYRDITMEEFITKQIKHRIKLKFQKPEVEKTVDFDKEILKIIVYTLKTYGYKDFSSVELSNLLTNNTITLSQAAIWARPIEQRF